MASKIVAVVGALGTQGSGVVDALINHDPKLKNPHSAWAIRALTSRANSPAAIKLAQHPGVTVVQVDLNSEQSVVEAFHGATHIFANTAFSREVFLQQGPEAAETLEAQQAVNIVRAAQRTESVRHLVYSTLPDSETISGGKAPHIPHFMSKIPAEKLIRADVEGLAKKTTYVGVGMYGNNLTRAPYAPINLPNDERYVITLPCRPDTPVPLTGDPSSNTGSIVRSIFEQSQKTQGRLVLAVSETLACKEWVSALSQIWMKQNGTFSGEIDFAQCSLHDFEKKWGAVGTEVGVMMRFFDEYGENGFQRGGDGLPALTPVDLGVQDEMRSTIDGLLALPDQKEIGGA